MSNGQGNKKQGPPDDKGNGNGRGPPPWAGPPDHVEEKQDGSVNVGQDAREKTIEQAFNSDDPQVRIEAKLDLLLDELGVDES
jgi:hypothetical protein